jgi:hypothetical protein
MRIFTTVLAAFTCLAPLAGAQEPANIRTTIVTYAPGELPAGMTAFFQNGGEILPFTANAGGLGEPIRYQGPKKLVLRSSVEEFGLSPEKMKPPIAVIDLPENCNNILLLAADAGGGKLRLIPFDVASGNLRPGDYKIFNFSDSVVSMIMGPQKFTISPRENKTITDPSWKGEAKAFSLKIATVNGKEFTLVNETMWEHYPQKRQVIFLFKGRRQGEPIGFMCFNVEPPLKFESAKQ